MTATSQTLPERDTRFKEPNHTPESRVGLNIETTFNAPEHC